MSQALDQFMSCRDEHGLFHVHIMDDDGNSIYLRFAPSSDADIDRGSCQLLDDDGAVSTISMETAFKTNGGVFLMSTDDFAHLLEEIESGRLPQFLAN